MKNLLLLCLSLSLVACGSDSKTEAANTKAPAAAAVPVQVEASDHNVVCGCSIDSVAECGNYVEFEGEYAKIMNSKEMDLGAMEWCHQDGKHATVAGTRTGNEFVLTEITVAE